jgi:hypothetical protein
MEEEQNGVGAVVTSDQYPLVSASETDHFQRSDGVLASDGGRSTSSQDELDPDHAQAKNREREERQ